MELGIVGLPQAGKKTVFELLTGVAADKAPTRKGLAIGTAAVRDPRIDTLSGMYNPKRTKYAEFQIVLLPDMVPGAERSSDWLETVRRVDALVEVVRAFPAPHVPHLKGTVDPARDAQILSTEFGFADFAMVETRLERLAKESIKGKAVNDLPEREKELLERCRTHLEAEKPLSRLEMTAEEEKLIRSLQFLTRKPTLVVLNAGEDLAAAKAEFAAVQGRLEAEGISVALLSAAIERELAELPAEERQAFMADLGIAEPASHRLSRAAYESLGLISFFTVGPDEVRAWPVRRGAKAPEAAGKIHTDIERGFIRAETVAGADLLRAGSERQAKADNLYALNGKDYVVRDGDVIEFRFNV
ncbi:MAG: redox-regulated ATPase YchF [Lentisphaerae bacterium RIFOXYB12_FULL_65_16]|nr:MAG: redox-regulated ATPase YchF [Lentisphaerae bacterium RIFOXYA12_64_32]OGV89346.1 MAG: redox-regulated ATPase YchF [Lentisphaerae bacterium RIFOXYB12_FULL_65_16]